MELKQYVNRAWSVYKKLLVKEAHLDSLSNTISKYGEREVEVFPAENSSETLALRWSDLKKECEELSYKLLVIDRETNSLLERLENPNYYTILYLRYIRRLSWQDVAKASNYSIQSVYRLHSEGLEALSVIVSSNGDLLEQVEKGDDV